MNLDDMDLAQLRKLQNDVQKAIATYEDRKRKEAMSEISEIAKKHGLTVDQLMVADGSKRKRSNGSIGEPKFVHKDNPNLTWTGRGRKPAWVEHAVEIGR